MGAFFSNVQAKVRDRDALVAAIRASVIEEGLDEVEAPADRGVLVLPPDDGGWIAIYDQAMEGGAGAPDGLAALASRHGDAFSVQVYDSDVVHLELFRRGKLVDEYDSYPDLDARPSAAKRQKVKGKPGRWAPLLVEGTELDLARAFGRKDLFAERTLREIARLVGCDPVRAATGFRYVHADHVELPEGTVSLHFRRRTRPSWETSDDTAPALSLASVAGDPRRLAVGDELRVGLSTRSTGRASRGIAIRSWGSALDAGLVAIDRFELLVGDVLKGGLRDLDIPAETTRSLEGGAMRVAERPEVALPAGRALPFEGIDGADVFSAMEAVRRSTVHVNVVGRVMAPGKGTLGVGLVPHENHDGAEALLYQLEVEPPIPRPLRAAHTASHVLRPLRGKDHLLAMVAVRDRTELARAVRALLEAARPALSPATKLRRATFHTSGARPTSRATTVKGLLSGAGLETLLADVEHAQVVTLDGRLSLAAGTGLVRENEPARQPWALVSVPSEAKRAAEVRDAWSALLDELARGGSPQATLATTGWSPKQVDVTPYESVCGVVGHRAVLRSWAERWLRLPGNDRVWLGASLRARIDVEALRALGEVSEIGPALRVTLRDDAEVRRLEDVLAPILPGIDAR